MSGLPAATETVDRRERWIRILDDLVRIPGTRLSFGLDVILGLLPVVGDFAGLLCGIPLVVAGVRRGLPFRVVLVMVANLLTDAVVGSVPVLGNLFDLVWKAHRKNLVLLESPEAVSDVLREARWKLGVLVGIVFVLLVALVYLLVFFTWATWKLWALWW